MSLPQFDDLPFNARPDLSPYLVHLTKNSVPDDDLSAFDNLVNILRTGVVNGSTTSSGFIKGPHAATCFMDVPFQALKYVLTPENSDPQKPRYEAYGVIITKSFAYKKRGCRPVLYLSNDEVEKVGIPKDELWRVVRFEVTDNGWISWVHEREWRCKGSFKLPKTIQAALVKNTKDAAKLASLIAEKPKTFKCIPSSIVPLTVVCQGLLRPGN